MHNLPLEFVAENDKRTEHHLSGALNGYKYPHVHVYVVKCSNMEVYKSQVHPRLRGWVDNMKQRGTGMTQL